MDVGMSECGWKMDFWRAYSNRHVYAGANVRGWSVEHPAQQEFVWRLFGVCVLTLFCCATPHIFDALFKFESVRCPFEERVSNVLTHAALRYSIQK